MKALTKRQKEVLTTIRDSIAESGYPPTIREIGDALGIKSTNGVNDHLKALERKKYIERGDAKSRAINLTDKALAEYGDLPGAGGNDPNADTVGIPVVGRIAAGAPIEAVENVEDRINIDRSMFSRGAADSVFALRVEGDSMINDGIHDGDLVFVKKQETARRGEIVAAIVDGSATVKRYYPEGSQIRLQPANDHMDPIYVSAENSHEVRIVGRVVGVYRQVH
jgi:repressor LexA